MKFLSVLGLLFLFACSTPSRTPASRDEYMQQQIAQQLQASREINGWNIRVQVINGNATLTGPVTSVRQKQEAERIAARVQGVRLIFNQIVIKE